jgi:BolA protein
MFFLWFSSLDKAFTLPGTFKLMNPEPEIIPASSHTMSSLPPSKPPSASQLEDRLRETLQALKLEVIDESCQHHGHSGANDSGFGSHFRIRITSHLFTGKSALMRHRLVYDALQDFMTQGLHALVIEAKQPQV